MRSVDFLSPPPSPHPAPLPLSTSSTLPLCPELDLSLPLSSDPKTKPTRPKPHPHRQTQGKRNRQVCFAEPVVVMVTAEPSNLLSNDPPPQQPTRSQSRRGHHHGKVHDLRAGPPVTVANKEQACLERAESNTSLALKAELESLQGAEFNSQKAVQETLQKSERTKNLINTKATDGVNVSRSQLLYSSLVSVNVEEDQLISQALQDRLLLAPPTRNHDSKSADAPSLLLFMTADLQRQKPLPPEKEPISNKIRPICRPAHSTFDLYRRHIRWQATP